MIRRVVTLPELGLIAGTRAALGAGVALLLADKLSPQSRRAVGWTLLAVGLLTTVPLVANVLLGGKLRETEGEHLGNGQRKQTPQNEMEPAI